MMFMRAITVGEILDAMEQDDTPKADTVYMGVDEETNEFKTCAIGGAAYKLGVRAAYLAESLMTVDVPKEDGDDENLLSPNYRDVINLYSSRFMEPTLRKRIEYLSDHTETPKSEVARIIREKYPDLLNIELLAPTFDWDEWLANNIIEN